MKDHDEKIAKQGTGGNGGDDDVQAAATSKIVPKERIEGNVKIVRGARAREPNPVFSVLQEPRSLLITTGRVYKSYLHGIAEREVDTASQLAHVANGSLLVDPHLRATVEKAKAKSELVAAKSEENGKAEDAGLPRSTRLSLTFRDVEKVSKGVAAMMAYLQGGKK